MESQILFNILENKRDRLLRCIVLSSMIHVLIAAGLSYHHRIQDHTDILLVTLKSTDASVTTTAPKETKIHTNQRTSDLDPETQQEVKRMMRHKYNTNSSSPQPVSDLCKTQKEIIGIGVKLSFGNDQVLYAPEYLPAYQYGVREGDYIRQLNIKNNMAYVEVIRAGKALQFSIPAINLCEIIKDDF